MHLEARRDIAVRGRRAALRDARGRDDPHREQPQVRARAVRRCCCWRAAKVLLGRGLPPLYDRAALAAERRRARGKEVDGRSRPHWRFKLDHDEPIEWDDGIRGRQHFEPAPLVRSGRAPRRRLVALHAAERGRRHRMGVTDVLRGEDHVSTPPCKFRCLPHSMLHPALRARGVAGGQRRQAVEASRLARLRCVSRARHRAGGAGRAARAARHLAAGRADRRSCRAGRELRSCAPSDVRRRGSTRPSSSGSMLRSSTSSSSRKCSIGCPKA